jgi:hypothetical protein
MYCGNREILPDGYANFGNRYNCLKKGYGVGRGILKDKIVNVIADQNLNPDMVRNRIQMVLDDNNGGGGGARRVLYKNILSQRTLIIFIVVVLLGFLGIQIYTLIKINKIEEEKKNISPS